MKNRRLIPVMFCFFAMGFVDLVGIASNYVKEDLMLSDAMANTLPSLVFLWFLIFSLPTSLLMNRIGRKRTGHSHHEHGSTLYACCLRISAQITRVDHTEIASIRSFSVPAGTFTSTTSPTFLPSNASAIGDLMEIFPSLTLASWGLTTV